VFMPFGVLISAVLVATVASRLLTHNKVTREEDDCKDIVRITHHLIAIIMDLRNRVEYSKDSFKKSVEPPVSVIVSIENAVVIEKRYEVLFDREAYRFLSSESVELISRMSASIFTLVVTTKSWSVGGEDKRSALLASISTTEQDEAVAMLDALLKDLNALEQQVRQLREEVEKFH